VQPWLQTLAAARHQAERLGNEVLALDLLATAKQRFSDDTEAQFHIRNLMQGLTPTSPPLTSDSSRVGECGTLLLDADQSGEAFIAQFIVRSGAPPGEAFSPSMADDFRRAIRLAQTLALQQLLHAGELDSSKTLQRGGHGLALV